MQHSKNMEFSSPAEAAVFWIQFRLPVIPISMTAEGPVALEADWPSETSTERIQEYWLRNPDAAVGCRLDNSLAVCRSYGPEAAAVLSRIEQEHGCPPLLRYTDAKGEYHIFLLTSASDANFPVPDSQEKPSFIEVYLEGSVIALPPLADGILVRCQAENVDDLFGVDSDFLRAASQAVASQTTEHSAQQDEPATRLPAPDPSHPLEKHSLRGMAVELAAGIAVATYVLLGVALGGQSTVIYGPPNSGKTLLILHMLIESILRRAIDASHLFYINVDDTGPGLIDKLKLGDKHGFHMLAEGYRDFEAKELFSILRRLVETGDACRSIIVLDTLKRFTNLMDKTMSSRFTAEVRRFVLAGGTVIALAHTNKNKGLSGKSVYSGTADIVDDFDCAYILDEVAARTDDHRRAVELRNIKRRGDVVPSLTYSYSLASGTAYGDLLASVKEVSPDETEAYKRAAELQVDGPLIAAIEQCIREERPTKMILRDTAAARAKTSKNVALAVIEKYTGEDPKLHRWTYEVGSRGAQFFVLLASSGQ